MIKFNQPYKCKHCGKVYIILQGYYPWSFLPVELNAEQLKTPSPPLRQRSEASGEGERGWAFDKTKHISHLKNCPKLQAQWEDVKKQIMDQIKNNEKYAVKELLK